MPNIGPSNTPPSKKDEWRTLPELYGSLKREFQFEFDFAATEKNALEKKFFTKETNILERNDWFWDAYNRASGFLNPPFSMLDEFLSAADEQVQLAGMAGYYNPVIVCLVKADSPEASWWRKNVLDSDGYIRHEVRMLWPRLPYCNPDGEVKNSPRWPSALVIMRPTPWRYIRWFNWKVYTGIEEWYGPQ